jgi:hypothetical protein
MVDIGTQFKSLMDKANPIISNQILLQMESFAEEMVDNIIPIQRGFKNLTGNTITSFSYGLYYKGVLQKIGSYNGKSAIRTKLSRGDIFDGIDYDGNKRRFLGEVDTDGSYGLQTAINFLKSQSPIAAYALIFTTGTEYSVYLENKMNSNVLTDAKIFSITSFIQSFKPIE